MTTSTVDMKSEIEEAFRRQFGAEPEFVARAPGRVNLIGEHTDYNEGFVLPMAIDREILIAADRNCPEGIVELYSADYEEIDSFSTFHLQKSQSRIWPNYVRGVIATLNARGLKIPGFRALISGNVPRGSGLSSSAALEVATATLLNEMGNYLLDGKEIALLAQKAENEFVGVECGIMDQFVSALAQKDTALLIDCRDLSYECIPLSFASESYSIVITNSGVSRGLKNSKFNERRAECQEGLRLIKEATANAALGSLRELDAETLEKNLSILPENIAKRVNHVVSENERVKTAAAFLRCNDLSSFGKLMIESHNSLRDDYEVSCPELDKLVELSLAMPACLGARMTGAGFGGCTVALFAQSSLSEFSEQVLEPYYKATEKKAQSYVCSAVPGANLL